MNNEDIWKDPSPWNPITEPVTLKHLGKLGEEVNELGKAICRTIIQGIDGVDPESGKTNRQQIIDEVTDVSVGVRLLYRLIHPSQEEIEASETRHDRKMKHLTAWHQMAGGEPRAWEYEEWLDGISGGRVAGWYRAVSLQEPRVNQVGIRNVRGLR